MVHGNLARDATNSYVQGQIGTSGGTVPSQITFYLQQTMYLNGKGERVSEQPAKSLMMLHPRCRDAPV